MSPDARWKRQERQVADILGGIRLPNSGRGQPDVRADRLAVQVKTTKALPTWLLDAVAQAERDAAEGELPLVVLNQVSQGKAAKRLIVMDLATLVAWQGPASSPAAPPP